MADSIIPVLKDDRVLIDFKKLDVYKKWQKLNYELVETEYKRNYFILKNESSEFTTTLFISSDNVSISNNVGFDVIDLIGETHKEIVKEING